MSRRRVASAVVTAALLAGCASPRPVLYPNALYEEQGEQAAQAEVDRCIQLAHTYAGVIAHAADGMFDACSRAKGVPNPHPDVEKTLTDKAQIVKALAKSIALCDEVFGSLTEQNAQEFVRQGPAGTALGESCQFHLSPFGRGSLAYST